MPTPQQQINYGNTANDGQGDPLRTAFIKVDDNFDAIWNAGPVGSNITMLNNSVSVVTANGNLVLSANGVGVIQTNSSLVPQFANSYDLGTANLRYRSIAVGSGGASIAGNVSAAAVLTDNYLLANGAPFSPGSDYGNANVADFLPTYTGTISANNVVTTNFCVPAANNSGNLGSGNRHWASLWVDTIQGPNTAVTGNLSVNGNLQTGSIVNEFPVFITTNGNTSWEFAGNILRGPEGGSWQSAADTIYLRSPDDGYITLESIFNGNIVSELFMEHSFIRFLVDNGGPEKTWQMNLSGEFSVPGDIIPQGNGTASLGNATNYWSNLWVANNTIYIGGVPLGVTGNTLTVNGEAVLSNDSGSSITTTGNISAGNILVTGNMDAQNLVVTNIAEIGDISIAGGYITLVDGSASTGIDISPNPEGQAFLQVPNDDTANTANLRVVNNAGNVRIETNAGTIWTFAYNGDLNAPGNISANAILTDNYFYANGEPFVSSSTGNITFTNTTMSPPDGEDLFITAANSEVEITGQDFRVEVTDDVRIQGNDIVSIRNTSNNEAITIRTDYNGNDYSWEFDATGNLTAPGSITVSGDITVAGHITGTSAASTLVLAAEPSSNTAIQLNDTVDSIIGTVANLEIRTDVSNTPRLWRFDTNGDLTVPNYINFKDGTFVGDEGGAGTPVFRVDSPLGLGINLTTDSDITGNNYTWSFAIDGVLTAPGAVTATGNVAGGNLTTSGQVVATGNITGGNLITTGNVVGNVSGFAIGYRDIPQVSFTGNATIATTDAGKHFYSTESTDYVLTIANNASQGFAVGAAITIVNQGTGNITIAQGSGVSLYLAGNATSGNRTLSTFGMATIIKVATDTWFINGSGIA